MLIFIQIHGTRHVTLEVESSDTIYKVKELIQVKEGTSPAENCLIFSGIILEDGRTLSYYGIQNTSTLHSIIRLHGGGFCQPSLFQDLTKSTVVRPWSNGAPPWRMAVGGLNLEGKIISMKSN